MWTNLSAKIDIVFIQLPAGRSREFLYLGETDKVRAKMYDFSNYKGGIVLYLGTLNNEQKQAVEILDGPELIIAGAGTGKTHLAKWIAKQIGLPVVLARLEGLMSSFLGTTAKNIGNLFSFANRYNCVLLLDEFDAIAKLRNDPQEVGEVKRVVNTLLQCLDSRKDCGFTIGVTNHEALLDPAVWRRFDVQIEIPKPSPQIIIELVKKFLYPLNFGENEIKLFAWCIEEASGADIEMLAKWIKRAYVVDNNITASSFPFAEATCIGIAPSMSSMALISQPASSKV